jgi:hypothetical protein
MSHKRSSRSPELDHYETPWGRVYHDSFASRGEGTPIQRYFNSQFQVDEDHVLFHMRTVMQGVDGISWVARSNFENTTFVMFFDAGTNVRTLSAIFFRNLTTYMSQRSSASSKKQDDSSYVDGAMAVYSND